jgi:FtsH-binding integral membrane protein
MLLTTAIIALFCLHADTKMWVRRNPSFTIISYVAALILMIALVCCENARRKSPTNMILLALFTLTEGIVVGAIASTYK